MRIGTDSGFRNRSEIPASLAVIVHSEALCSSGAGALLGLFLEEIGPLIYNKAVADVQERLQARVAEVDIEVQEDEFQYWPKFERQKRGK